MSHNGSPIDIANLPEDTEDLEIDYKSMYNRIVEFYSDSEKSVEPIDCTLGGTNTQTSIGHIPSNPTNVESINRTDIEYTSGFEQSELEDIGIDVDNIWNGRVASVRYRNNGILDVAETDYYSIALFSRLLMLESSNSQNIGDMSFRKRYAGDIGDFADTPDFCTGASSAGLIVGKRNGSIQAILGERSSYTDVNTNLYSLAPSGVVRPDSLAEDGGFLEAVKMRFKNELFGYKEMGTDFIEREVECQRVMTGWNLRNASMTVAFLLYIPNESAFEDLLEDIQSNREYQSLETVNIENIDIVSQYTNLDTMSPICITVLARCLEYMKNSDGYPDIPYKVNTSYKTS